ncbi:MAG: hypothetical protein M1813_009291 [Trichoglossum hirsutum]|nr:MAG: hypothetical protein M1813_009291 [Trichoglossum hirsutum]
MPQDTALVRNKEAHMRRQHGMILKEAKSAVWDDWSGRGFHVNFSANDNLPLQREDRLGSGSFATVYKTFCKGVTLAWKAEHRPRSGELKEIESLKRLNHQHIVKLVGTFTHLQHLNLLLWPVATCDLATFLSDLSIFKKNNKLLDFSDVNPNPIHRFDKLGIEVTTCVEAQKSARAWLYQKFGCLAEAISYLHSNDIKHKDLKPSNILLSRKGLWLTDFGISRDFSTLPSSQSDNGERGTPLYFAPEVAERQPNGRPADIFSLGCIFMEMFWATCMPKRTMEDLKAIRSAEDCSFQANLKALRQECVSSILSITDREVMAVQKLLPMISQMLHPNPQARPQASDVKSELFLIDWSKKDREWSLHSRCCQPVQIKSKPADWNELKRFLNERNQPFALIYAQPTSRRRDSTSSSDITPTDYQTPLPQPRESMYASDPDLSVSSLPETGQPYREPDPEEDKCQAPTVEAAAEHQKEVGNNEVPRVPSPATQTSQAIRDLFQQFSTPLLGMYPFQIAELPASSEHQVTKPASGPATIDVNSGMEHQLPQVASGGASAPPPAILPSSHHLEHPELSHVERGQDACILDAQTPTKWNPNSKNPYRNPEITRKAINSLLT